MSNKPIPTRPLTDNEKFLREKFYETIVAQNELLDKWGERLLTLELAIPGLYAAVLKLVAGDNATMTMNAAFYITFGSWLLALVLTLVALFPKKWTVNPTVLRQSPDLIVKQGLGIEDFFEKPTQHKRRLLTVASVLFFVGIFSSAFTI